MKHLNGNLICAVDVETTGVSFEKHEIMEVCFLPLDVNLEPHRGLPAFEMMLKPEWPERISGEVTQVTGIKKEDLLLHGMDKYRAADLFTEWFEKLKLPHGKRIVPLAHNWPFDSAFIKKWLGFTAYDMMIDGRYRDTMVVSLWMNDRADVLNEPCPFQKNNLPYVALALGVPHEGAHRALNDCIVTAKCYKLMVQRGMVIET
jgi:DNA polymerase III epsilon subunit-like protein